MAAIFKNGRHLLMHNLISGRQGDYGRWAPGLSSAPCLPSPPPRCVAGSIAGSWSIGGRICTLTPCLVLTSNWQTSSWSITLGTLPEVSRSLLMCLETHRDQSRSVRILSSVWRQWRSLLSLLLSNLVSPLCTWVVQFGTTHAHCITPDF